MSKAKLRFVMVHNWNRAAHVRPGTGVLVGEGGEYVEYYVNLAAVKTLQTSPRIWLGGRQGLLNLHTPRPGRCRDRRGDDGATGGRRRGY
jgi:hypothetical protein